jgi:lysophospholipase L1-like esterase
MNHTSSPLSLRKKLCFSLLTTTLFLGLLETAARLFGESGQDERYGQIASMAFYLSGRQDDLPFEADPQRFWRLKSGLEIPASHGPFWGGKISNQLGFRGPEISTGRPAGTTRIACFGDSTTFGLGVAAADAWPARLEAGLNAGDSGRFEVINAGVPGYTSYQGLKYMEQQLPILKPDVVLATFGNNDGWRWDDKSDIEHARLNCGSLLKSLARQSRAVAVVARWWSTRAKSTARPSRTDWAKLASDNFFSPEADWEPRVNLDDFAGNLRAMAELCRRRQAQLVLVVWPDREQLVSATSLREPYQAVIREVAEEFELPVVDLVTSFRQRSWESPDYYLANDIIHVGRRGNRVAARGALQTVSRLVPVTEQHAKAELSNPALVETERE